VLDGVDAGLGNGGFQVLDTILGEAHEFGYRRRRAHGHFLVAHACGQPDLHRGGFGLAHYGISVEAVPRQSVSAVMSSPCGLPSENASMAVHIASRIPSAFSAGQVASSFLRRYGPNSSSPLKTSVRPSV